MTLFNNALPGSGPGKQTKGKVIGIMPDLANGGCIVLLHVDDRSDADRMLSMSIGALHLRRFGNGGNSNEINA